MVLVGTTILLLILFLILLYKWLTKTFDTFVQRNIPYEKPKLIWGNFNWRMLIGKNYSLIRFVIDQYQQFKDEKVYGSFNFREAVITIRDPELIKKVTIKDFDHFPNHRIAFPGDDNSIFGKTLFVLNDHVWKDMRNILSPSFTGSKMRTMFELLKQCCVEGVQYLEDEIKLNGENKIDIEVKDYFTRFTNDMIATSAFGITVNSFKNKNNEFYTMGKKLTKLHLIFFIKILLKSMMPKITKALNISLMDAQQICFFKKLVKDTIKYRQTHKISRPDMIELLMEAKRQHEENNSDQKAKHIDFDDENLLLAQCFIFFLAGYETVSTCLCFTLHELLLNQDVQERLYEEILQTERDLNGKPLTYDALVGMKYMDMVISESLRKWPPAVATDRQCKSDYNLTDNNGNLITQIKKGDILTIPIVGLHYDERYYKDPYKFDPDRFSEDRKDHFYNIAYMPFGVGPRSCIANRLALLEVKSIIYHILLKFRVSPNEKTVENMLTSIAGLRMDSKGGFWTRFTPRENIQQ